MKRCIACVLTFFVFIMFSGVVTAVEAGEGAAPAMYTTSGEQKVYCGASLEDDFAADRIMVVLSNEASLEFNDYDTDDFPEIDCDSVRDLSNASKVKVKSQVEKVRTAFLTKSTEIETLDLSGIDTFNQVICLELQDASKENVLAAIEELQKRDDVIYAGPDYAIIPCSSSVNDELFEDQWAYETIQLTEAWEITTGSSAVVVGILDSGIDTTHPDLQNRVDTSLSYDFTGDVDASGGLTDVYGHGTRIAGVIGAISNNEIGISGVCWNVTLVSLKVINDTGGGYSSDVARAIDYADEQGIPILNLSARWYSNWGNYDYPLSTVIENYSGLFVCSAGNENLDNDSEDIYPAEYTYPNLITVGASTTENEKWYLSNYGKNTVDIFAPGQNIMTTFTGGSYAVRHGTSIAASFVTGVAALLLSQYPEMTAAQLKNAIVSHAEIVYDEEGNSVFADLCVSGGLLNAYKALRHEYVYSAINSSEYHGFACEECGYSGNEDHTWSHTSTGALNYHISRCDDCGYAVNEAHNWLYLGTFYRCTDCGLRSENVYINGGTIGGSDNLLLKCSNMQYSNMVVKKEEVK